MRVEFLMYFRLSKSRAYFSSDLSIFTLFRQIGMAVEVSFPNDAYITLMPDYTVSFRVHVCSSEPSDLSFVYRFKVLLYTLGTLTTV